MNGCSEDELKGAMKAIASMAARSEEAREKFASGTSQHTLQVNRVAALRIAESLLADQLAGATASKPYNRGELENACKPLASLISKSEKAQAKLDADTWQYRMLEDNLRALRIAAPLLEEALLKACA